MLQIFGEQIDRRFALSDSRPDHERKHERETDDENEARDPNKLKSAKRGHDYFQRRGEQTKKREMVAGLRRGVVDSENNEIRDCRDRERDQGDCNISLINELVTPIMTFLLS